MVTDATTPLESPQLEGEILERVRRLDARHSYVFGKAPTPARTVATVAKRYADDLRGQRDRLNPENARLAAIEVMSHLVDSADLDDAGFWRTTLGRAVAWHVGYFEDSVPAPIAAAILDMSRQAVHDAKQRGTLATVRVDGIPQAGVGRDSVRAYLRAQHGVRA